MDTNALFNIGYGLYVLTTKDNEKDNGCIVNTVMQVTSNPCQIAVCVNKMNYTNEMIKNSKKFNVSILSKNSKFDIFEHFGYKSGKDSDKFADFSDVKRSENGLLYVTKDTNAYICAEVKQEIDFDTHTMFIAEVVDAKTLSDVATVTYEHYQSNIKPKPQKTEKSGWRCKICGYVYEGEVLPDDYICPLCKHGAVDFEKI